MDKLNYKNMEELKNECNKNMDELVEPLKDIKVKLDEFYENMRWKNIECSSEEYEKLYDNMIYPYENSDIRYHLSKIIEFFDKEERKHI